MTSDAVRAGTPRAVPLSSNVLTGLTLVAGSIALIVRPVSDAFVPITVVVAVAGALHGFRQTRGSQVDVSMWVGSVVIGIGAFAVARVAIGETLLPPVTTWLLVTLVVAAIAEEAFFRGFMYGVFLRWGTGVAIAASSFLFGAIHVRAWGWRALPVDIAAGVLLGWQRAATGSWTAPAVTHVVANVVILS